MKIFLVLSSLIFVHVQPPMTLSFLRKFSMEKFFKFKYEKKKLFLRTLFLEQKQSKTKSLLQLCKMNLLCFLIPFWEEVVSLATTFFFLLVETTTCKYICD